MKSMKRLTACLGLGITALGTLANSSSVWAEPAQIIIIRHAEKPKDGNDLNEKGFERANALVKFFKTNPQVTQHGTPVAIFAMAPENVSGTKRPIETVTPLAKDLKITINQTYKKEDIEILVKEIKGNAAYDGKTVLICWAHHGIPRVAQEFGVTQAPQKWPSHVIDRAWIIDLEKGKVVAFRNIPQNIMPGDSTR